MAQTKGGWMEKEFVNPTDGWSYCGDFSVVLAPFASVDHIPKIKEIVVIDKILIFTGGQVKQSSGVIDFFINDQCITFSISDIRLIRNGSDGLLWKNPYIA